VAHERLQDMTESSADRTTASKAVSKGRAQKQAASRKQSDPNRRTTTGVDDSQPKKNTTPERHNATTPERHNAVSATTL